MAMKFVTEMQAVHPHSAYRLTSSGYHQEIPEALFTDSVVRDVAGQMSAAKPRLVSHSYPPEGSKATGQARIVVRIPRDEAVGDHTMQLLMIREGTANDQWYVQSFTLVNDSIGKDIPKDTPAK